MSLQTQAMLVTLSVSCWTGRVQDKKVSAEVEQTHGAIDAGRYNKLLVDKAHMDPLVQFAGKVRQYHYKMTLPWLDNGARLLPSALFLEYSTEIRKLKADYERVVDAFIQLYDPNLIQAARQRLGTMYDPEDYPPGADLRDKFGITVDIVPVPDGQDFRVDVGDAERTRISREISEAVAQRQAQAEMDAWQRCRSVVSTIQTRLSSSSAWSECGQEPQDAGCVRLHCSQIDSGPNGAAQLHERPQAHGRRSDRDSGDDAVKARFEALPENDQKTILDKHRNRDVQDDWWDSVYDSFKTDMELIGIEVTRMYFSGFWSQGDGACFEGHVADWPKFLTSINAHSRWVHKDIYDELSFSCAHSGHYYHHHCTNFNREFGADNTYDEGTIRFHAMEALLEECASEVEDFFDQCEEAFKDHMKDLYNFLEERSMNISKEQRKAVKRIWLRFELPRPPYRTFRRSIQGTFCMDDAIIVPFFGMWLVVETNGHTHS